MGGSPVLVMDILSGPVIPPIHPASDKTTTLGRSSQCEVVLGDEAVSRRHCALSCRQGQWSIADLGSRHGTTVNGATLAPNVDAPLKSGDMVGVGPWLFRVKLGGGSAGVSAASSSAQGQRYVTLMGGPAAPAGGAGAAAAARERVERVQERELAAITQNRLTLLMEVAAAVAGCSSEDDLAATIAKAASKGSGFPRAFVLRDDHLSFSGAGASAEAETLRIVHEIVPEAAPAALSATPPLNPAEQATSPRLPITNGPTALSFSRSLIQAARNGEVARLTSEQGNMTQSIMSLGIQTALCAPITLGGKVTGFLYLDARAGESKLARASMVQTDAAAYCSALAKMYSLALGNLSRVELERRQKELVRDLESAREAQKLIMPPERGVVGGVRYSMRCRSGRYVAGDLFDVVNIGDGRVAVVLGDVAGKGIPAAMLMATAQAHLNSSLHTFKDAAQAVTAANRHISHHISASKFISLWLGVFDLNAGTLTFVDAGHGHWLFLPKGQPPRRVESATGIPMGIDADYTFHAEVLPFSPEDRLLVFSDGVVEQSGEPGTPEEGRLFGLDRVIEAIEGCTNTEDHVERVFSAVVKYAASESLADDTTVACIMAE